MNVILRWILRIFLPLTVPGLGYILGYWSYSMREHFPSLKLDMEELYPFIKNIKTKMVR